MHARLKPLLGVSLFLCLLACLAGIVPSGQGESRMTWMTFATIRAGMTEQEVQNLAGNAGRREAGLWESGVGLYEVKYAMKDDPAAIGVIGYRAGAVREKRIARLDGDSYPRISEHAFRFIREGMRRDEVLALSGPGQQVANLRVGNVEYVTERYLCSDPEDQWVFIKYQDGRVRAKVPDGRVCGSCALPAGFCDLNDAPTENGQPRPRSLTIERGSLPSFHRLE